MNTLLKTRLTATPAYGEPSVDEGGSVSAGVEDEGVVPVYGVPSAAAPAVSGVEDADSVDPRKVYWATREEVAANLPVLPDGFHWLIQKYRGYMRGETKAMATLCIMGEKNNNRVGGFAELTDFMLTDILSAADKVLRDEAHYEFFVKAGIIKVFDPAESGLFGVYPKPQPADKR